MSEAVRNAFSREYLEALAQRDEASTFYESETAGPLKLEEVGGAFALFYEWESSEAGDVPLAVFQDRETALTFQAIWPAVGRSRVYRVREPAGPEGFALELEGAGFVGRLRHFAPDAVYAAHVGAFLARTPFQLSLLVEAAGPGTQKMLGRILAERLVRLGG
jgi:hypothetical protein